MLNWPLQWTQKLCKKRERQHFHRTIKGGKIDMSISDKEAHAICCGCEKMNPLMTSKYRPRIWKIRITSFGKSYLREWQCTSLVVNPPLMHTFPLSMFTLANTTSGNFMANSYEKMIINSTIDKKNSLGVGWGRKDPLPGSHWRLGA